MAHCLSTGGDPINCAASLSVMLGMLKVCIVKVDFIWALVSLVIKREDRNQVTQ